MDIILKIERRLARLDPVMAERVFESYVGKVQRLLMFREKLRGYSKKNQKGKHQRLQAKKSFLMARREAKRRKALYIYDTVMVDNGVRQVPVQVLSKQSKKLRNQLKRRRKKAA